MLLVETNPAFWEAGGEAGEAASVRDAGFAAFFEQLVVFVQAFSLLNFQNKLVVVAVHGDGCHFLYDNVDAARADKDGGYEFAGTAGEIVARRMRELAASAPRGDPAPSPLSGAPRHNAPPRGALPAAPPRPAPRRARPRHLTPLS